MRVPDSHGTAPIVTVGKRVPLPLALANREEFDHYIRNEVLSVEQHEIDEWLKVDGKRLRNPHP